MSSYSIKVNCTCGKILKVPEKYAGKRVKCPCEKKISIPTIDEIKKKIGEHPEELRNCPTCGAFLNKDDVICVACRMNLQTGEWDSNATPAYTKPKSMRFEYLTTAALVILIIIAGIWVLPGKDTNDSNSEHREINMTNDNENILSAIDSIQKNMPEDTSLALKKKIETFSDLAGSEITKAIQQLEAKKYEVIAKEAFEEMPKNTSPMEQWHFLEQLAYKFQGTSYVSKNIRSEQQKVLKEIVSLIVDHGEAMQIHAQNENYHALLMESFTFASTIPFSLRANSDVRTALSGAESLYSEALSQLEKRNKIETAQPQEVKSEELDLLVKRIQQEITPKYKTLLGNWEFKKALNIIAPVAFESEKYVDSNMPEILQVKKMHEEAISYNKLWEIIEQGTTFSIGKSKLLYLRNSGEVFKDGYVNGEIKSYQNGEITFIDLRSKEEKRVYLRDLRADQLINTLAMESDFPKEHIHGLSIPFYMLNGMASEIKYVVENKISSPTEQQNTALAWAQQILSKKEIIQDEIANKIKTDAENNELARKEDALEKDKKRAWDYCQKVVDAFNVGNFESVIDNLQRIKDILPKDEVIKMSKRLDSEQGYSLKDFAGKALEMCAICEEGKLKCSFCLGKGQIVKKMQLKDTTYDKVSFCKNCIDGKINCPRCSQRRFSKPYNMLVTWYKDLY